MPYWLLLLIALTACGAQPAARQEIKGPLVDTPQYRITRPKPVPVDPAVKRDFEEMKTQIKKTKELSKPNEPNESDLR